MSLPEWIGSTGVALLLGAFFLNLIGRLSRTSRVYHVLNVVGAGLSCYASHLIGFVPFVVLEGTWSAVALVALLRLRSGTQTRSRCPSL